MPHPPATRRIHPPTARRLRIALVASYDVTDVHSWSGIAFYVLQTLQRCGFDVVTIGALEDIFSLSCRLKFYQRKLRRVRYIHWLEPEILRGYGQQIAERIRDRDIDVVVSLGSAPISYLEISQPIVFLSDATFAALKNFYPDFTGLSPETLRNGDDMEQRALSRCAKAIFTSDWAAQSALKDYAADPQKVEVIPFGANIESNRTRADIVTILQRKSFDICKLLFVGVDWKRKGGDRALEVANMLNRRGLPTELHIVGCEPPSPTPDFVVRHGFVSKKSPEGAALFDRLLMDSHFLVVPSLAECYGLVFAEASSFGLPSFATRVGGIPTVVVDGVNGYTLDLAAPASDYCDLIENLFRDRDAYDRMALACFREYTERLNWHVAGERIQATIKSVCAEAAAPVNRK